MHRISWIWRSNNSKSLSCPNRSNRVWEERDLKTYIIIRYLKMVKWCATVCFTDVITRHRGFPLPAAFPSVGPGPSKASENSAAGGHQSESATGGPGTNSINIDFMTKKKHGKKHGNPWYGQRYGLLEIVWKSQNCSCAVLVSLRYLTFKIFRAIKTKSFGMVKPETCNMTLGTMPKGKAWKSYV